MPFERGPTPEKSSREKEKDLIERVEDSFDRASDFIEASADKGMDFVERIGNKIDDSYLMHRLRIMQERLGILGAYDIPGLSDEELLSWYKNCQEMAAGIQKEIEIGMDHSSGDKIYDKRFVDERQARLEGNQGDLDKLKAEIDRRRL